MSHTIRLSFGPLVTIEITRDAQRRVSQLETFFSERVEGYRLDTNPERKEGTFYAMPSNIIGERYKDGKLHSPNSFGEGNDPIPADYHAWIRRCVQQATAWARSAAITAAHSAAAKGNYSQASETYRDVLDHFPPPPEAPLLHWAYYCCIAEMDGVDVAYDGLLMWFHDALQIAGLDAISAVLHPAHRLLGEEQTKTEAEQWLSQSSPHDPAHKMTVRWLNQLGQGEPDRTRWEHLPGLPSQSQERAMIVLPSGDVIATGGLGADRKPSNQAAKWCLRNQQWEPICPLPHGLHRHSMVCLFDGTVLVIGGEEWDGNKRKRYSRNVWAWHADHNTWQPKTPLHIGRQDFDAIIGQDGRVVVVGGESPLQTDACVEYWDRRSNAWAFGPPTGIRLRSIQLKKFGRKILISGPSVCASGSGAMVLDIANNSIGPFDAFKGIGIGGLQPLITGEVVIWAKNSNELNVGIWDPKKKNLVWTCTEISLPKRDDLAQLHPCEEQHFLLLYIKDNGSCGARFVRPSNGLVDEIDEIGNGTRLESINTITLSDGRVLAADHQGSMLLST